MGRFDHAVDLCRRAREQDPLCAPAWHNYGFALHAANRLPEAKEAYRRALELAPQKAITRENLALVLLAQGLRDEALAEAEREPEEWARLFAVAIAHHERGDRSSSDAAFRDLIEKHAADSSKQIAEVYALRGEFDAAFEWLERSYAQRDGALCEIKTSLYLRLLHGDPRWDAFVRKMGFDR
jgi:Flp pilus assembly protein TadD